MWPSISAYFFHFSKAGINSFANKPDSIPTLRCITLNISAILLAMESWKHILLPLPKRVVSFRCRRLQLKKFS